MVNEMQIQKLWLNYCNSTTLSTDLLITLSKISVLDQRWDTKPEMRLMLGSMADVEKNGLPSHVPYVDSESSLPDDLSPQLTMLIMDLHFKPNSQAVVIRVQRPRLLVVVDFLLAVAVYFVPSLGDVTGRNDSESSETDELFVDNHLRLSTRIYEQEDEMVILSSDRQLVADAYDIDDYIYDGCGKTLCLNVKDDGYDSWEPLIIIGWRKRLHFKNVYIKNGLLLSNCIHLSFDSSYSASFDDGVVLEGMGTDTSGGYLMQSLGYNDLFSSPLASPTTKKQMAALGNCVIDIQAVAPEFTFYDSTNWPSGSPGRERVLRANLDCYLMVAFKGNDRWIRGQVKGLTIEGGSGLVVVDPVDISAEYACVQDRMTMMVAVSDISMRLSFSVISLVLRFHDDALSTFHLAGMSPLSRCTHFDRIWANISSKCIYLNLILHHICSSCKTMPYAHHVSRL
jgi:vacuolar protein sorting-associated protein 13A/C